MSEMALPFDSSQEENKLPTTAASRPALTTPEGDEPVQWQVVAKQTGLMQATIVAGRLQAAGIPSRAWQESAGQAIGLTVGLLGIGYVAVPAEYEEQALTLLAADEAFEIEESGEGYE